MIKSVQNMKGSDVVRVTKILDICGVRQWPSCISQADRDWYCQRGQAIHSACELYDKGVLDWEHLDERIVGFVQGYERFRKELRWVVVSSELEVECPRLGYAGRLDRVFKMGSSKILVDIKTNEADDATALQTAGYAVAYGKKVKRAAVGLKEDGTYRMEWYKDDARDLATWEACAKFAIAIAGWRKINGVKEE